MYRDTFSRAAQRSAEDDAPATKTPLDPAAAQEEIAELRRKLGRLGNVNMEALQELQELETRSIDPFGIEAGLVFRSSASDADRAELDRLFMRDGLLVA